MFARSQAAKMQRSARRAELKAFLRARRAAVSPEQAGIARAGRRLTSGLRREEVAAIAGVGLTWYTWLEQGREISVSSDVLRRVSRALWLSASDETYLFTLAGVAPDRSRKAKAAVTPAMRKTIDSFTAGPALIFGPWFDVLAYNESADIIYSFDAASGRFSNNHIWRLFMDPMRQRIYSAAQLEHGARNLVGILRARYAEHVGRPELEELVQALQASSALFRKLWDERTTTSLETFNARFEHPTLGALEFYSVRATPGDAPADMIWLLPPADRRTELAMARALKLRRNKRKRSTR
jgi:transcriptional regulator with XRE-family HTH domain